VPDVREERRAHEPYPASPIDLPVARRRRKRQDIAELRGAIFGVVSTNAPMTVRQVFYRLVSIGLIEKSEAEYNNVVVRLVAKMRLDGELPWRWITDGTRWMHKSARYASVEEALEDTRRHYRRDYWRELDDYVEVWLEKDALAGVIFDVTDEWGVPLMVTRGFASLSYIHNAAKEIECLAKPTHIYYFGDYDPSGLEIDRNLERRLREFAPSSDIRFERVAVRREQIEEYRLPTRPTKTRTGHGRGLHEGDSVEVDAIPPPTLLQLVRSSIEHHVDRERITVLEAAEASERELLGGLAAMLERTRNADSRPGRSDL
jgi:hypothetical protein